MCQCMSAIRCLRNHRHRRCICIFLVLRVIWVFLWHCTSGIQIQRCAKYCRFECAMCRLLGHERQGNEMGTCPRPVALLHRLELPWTTPCRVGANSFPFWHQSNRENCLGMSGLGRRASWIGLDWLGLAWIVWGGTQE